MPQIVMDLSSLYGTLTISSSPVGINDIIMAGQLSDLTSMRTANGGQDTDSAPTVMLNVTQVNDAPEGTDKTITINEDIAYRFKTADFGFTDVNNNAFASVKLTTLPANGTLTLNGVLVLADQLVEAREIANLIWTPAFNANGANLATIDFQVTDDGGTANGAQNTDQSPNVLTFDVVPVNDAPRGASKAFNISENIPYTFSAVDFGFSDSDGDSFYSVLIGQVTGAGTYRINGTPLIDDQIIQFSQIGNLVYTPPKNGNGAYLGRLSFKLVDDGGTLNDGRNTDPTLDFIGFNVAPVITPGINDTPAGTNKEITISEGSSYSFAIADFGFTDINNDNFASVLITLLPANGTLTLKGVTVTLLQNISAVDIAASELIFTPTTDAVGGNLIRFKVVDDGGTANGGTDTDLSDKRIAFHIALVNDAPSGADKTILAVEDIAQILTVADFGFTDIDNKKLISVIMDTVATRGKLMLNGTAVAKDQEITIADLEAGKLSFISAENQFGMAYDRVAFKVKDDGGTAFGGINTDPIANILTFDVGAVVDTFTGTKTINRLIGTAGDDYFDGKAGNDLMIGKGGNDVFMFRTGYDRDTIMGFDAIGTQHDTLDIRRLNSITNFRDLIRNHADQVKADVVISGLNGDEIVLKNVKLGHLDRNDFLF